jgi:carbon-monoxide dehydrogenase small subunit
MIMATVDLLAETPDPSDAEIRDGLEGNLCRCTGYQNIVRAVHDAAGAMRTSPSPSATESAQPAAEEVTA